MIRIEAAGDYLAVQFPYSMLDAFKSIIPQGYRHWQRDKKRWLVSPVALDWMIDVWGAYLAPLPYDALRIAYR